MHALLEELARPFPPEDVLWKPGSTTKDGSKCMALCYADLRAYQERLDEVCGLDWSCRYVPWSNGSIICELTLYVGDALGRRESITRSSTGESDAQDEKNNMAGSVSEAMAFKRAAAMFGLGRYLYDLPSVWVEFDSQRKRISDAGQAELDKRYKAWYAKKTAAPKLPEVDFGMGKQDEAKGSPPHERMWGIGMRIFGPDWNNGARAWMLEKWSECHTPGNVRTSAGMFTDDEKTMIGDSMDTNAAALQKQWPKVKAAQP